MKRLAFIIAILMASGAMSACSQTEKGTETLADIKTSTSTATPSEVPESRIDTGVYDPTDEETQNPEKSTVSALQEGLSVYSTLPKKPVTGNGQANRAALQRAVAITKRASLLLRTDHVIQRTITRSRAVTVKVVCQKLLKKHKQSLHRSRGLQKPPNRYLTHRLRKTYDKIVYRY